MKKMILLIGFIFITNVFGYGVTFSSDKEGVEIDVKTPVGDMEIGMHHGHHFDYDASSVCGIDHTNCFNAYNHKMGINFHIQTRKAGMAFQLKVKHKDGCGWGWNHHISVALVDNLTGNMITSLQDINASSPDEFNVSFEVKNAYKNVSVKFFHMNQKTCDSYHRVGWMHEFKHDFKIEKGDMTIKSMLYKPFLKVEDLECHQVTIPGWDDKIIDCPTNLSDIKEIAKEEIPSTECIKCSTSFIYAIPKANKCYEIENPCDENENYISESSDSFAIRPDHFKVTIPSHIKANVAVPINIEVLNAKNEIITNYDNSSTNLKLTFKDSSEHDIKALYMFDINNGIGKGKVVFPEAVEDVTITVEDEHFADIDKDDTDEDDRKVLTDALDSLNSSSVASNGSKYWAGVGTNEVENKPTKNTINSDIKQNISKDLHYQKIGW